ncbi:hypothetical protein BDN70DRAFT_991249 [Pholiota conissans]|uniref:Uncharacterized protein n=1 Tax=Pholiota conissans TaxID=109636 RepID=A0A9P5Z993_9AGAR|nr:hypothetical protein BDN70DRAFT_991249 [Pholiota conissans]
MYPRFFLTVLPVLLSVVVPSLSLPVQSSDLVSVEARSFDLSSDSQAVFARDVADDSSLFERDDVEFEIVARADDEDIFRRATPRPKVSKAAQTARKDAVRAKVTHNQGANASKKAALIAANHPPQGKPARKKYKKDANGHITSGWRADARAKGFRPPKQPKTPKPNMAKGEHKTNAKAVASQAAANARRQAKKAAGRAHHAPINAIHEHTRTHGNMPARDAKYHVPGHGTLKGKAVRTGAYNLAKQEVYGHKKDKYPVAFKNMEQGPPGGRHVPIPTMAGHGHEYPINNQRHGFHATSTENPGPVRGIYQKNAAGGYNIQGVVAHDTTKKEGDAGYNDHHLITPTHGP